MNCTNPMLCVECNWPLEPCLRKVSDLKMACNVTHCQIPNCNRESEARAMVPVQGEPMALGIGADGYVIDIAELAKLNYGNEYGDH